MTVDRDGAVETEHREKLHRLHCLNLQKLQQLREVGVLVEAAVDGYCQRIELWYSELNYRIQPRDGEVEVLQ